MNLIEFKAALQNPENQGYECSVSRTLEIFTGKWTARVIYELMKKDSTRPGELKRNLPGITNTMLTKTLRQLEENGLVTRVQFEEIPPRVEYGLSEAALDMLPIFLELSNWGDKYLAD